MEQQNNKIGLAKQILVNRSDINNKKILRACRKYYKKILYSETNFENNRKSQKFTSLIIYTDWIVRRHFDL